MYMYAFGRDVIPIRVEMDEPAFELILLLTNCILDVTSRLEEMFVLYL